MTNNEFYKAVSEGKMTDEIKAFATEKYEKYAKERAERDALNAVITEHIRNIANEKPLSAGQYTETLLQKGVDTSVTRVSMVLRALVVSGEMVTEVVKVKGRWTNGYRKA